MKRYTASIWGNKYNQLINNGCCLVSIVAAVMLDRMELEHKWHYAFKDELYEAL